MLLQSSPVPTYILPGVEDWANCPNPDQAWTEWFTNFNNFEDAFGHYSDHSKVIVGRQIGRLENFAFVQSGVLILGIHAINDKMKDEESTNKRNADALEWIRYMTVDLGRQARAVVVLGNAKPSGFPQNEQFFQDMAEFLHGYGKPAVYVHANPGEGSDEVEEYFPFEEKASDIKVVQVATGGKNPPVQIVVGTGSKPFTIK